MPPKKILQETTDAFRGVMAEFHQDLRDMLRESIETAVRVALQERPPAPANPHRDERRVEEEDDDGDDDVHDDNPFAGLREQPLRQLPNREIAARRVENNRWDSGFKMDLPDFHGSVPWRNF